MHYFKQWRLGATDACAGYDQFSSHDGETGAAMALRQAVPVDCTPYLVTMSAS